MKMTQPVMSPGDDDMKSILNLVLNKVFLVTRIEKGRLVQEPAVPLKSAVDIDLHAV